MYKNAFTETEFTFKRSDNQDGLFTPHHTRFETTLSYNGHSYTFDYQCNEKYSMPNKKDCLECLLSDCSAVEDNTFHSFCQEFGYEYTEKAEAIYNSCLETLEAINNLYTREDLDEIYNNLY